MKLTYRRTVDGKPIVIGQAGPKIAVVEKKKGEWVPVGPVPELTPYDRAKVKARAAEARGGKTAEKIRNEDESRSMAFAQMMATVKNKKKTKPTKKKKKK